MASRRDAMTRAVRQYERDGRGNVPVVDSNFGRREATQRYKGRRGVRARNRIRRIVNREMNGTYTQPSGGTPSNS